uniref:Uncharacterized protein n=1 Tax=Megaselia scalaris TaxID=36166 RepID=T1GVM5_MEGSC
MQAQLPKGNHEDIEEVRKKKKDIDEKVKSERSSVAEMEKLYEQNQSNLNTLINRRNELTIIGVLNRTSVGEHDSSFNLLCDFVVVRNLGSQVNEVHNLEIVMTYVELRSYSFLA